VVRATQPSWAKCQLKPACALYFPAIGILRLDEPHEMLLVCEAGEFVILFMLPGVRSTSCWRDVAGLYAVQYGPAEVLDYSL
jgi:hypothetical protein